MNPKVDDYISKLKKWQEEMDKLRSIALDCQLAEELKWGAPCYPYQNSNVILIHGFKEYCALLFFKGALLSDANKILIQQTENVQSARQIRFTDIQQINKKEKVIKAYIYEAIEVEKAGLKVVFKKKKEPSFPEEFQKILNKNAALKKAFFSLTPGRQKGYVLHFSEAKQSKTRLSRIEKCMNLILQGKGLNDEYIRSKNKLKD